MSTVREHRLTPGWIRRRSRRPAVLATGLVTTAALLTGGAVAVFTAGAAAADTTASTQSFTKAGVYYVTVPPNVTAFSLAVSRPVGDAQPARYGGGRLDLHRDGHRDQPRPVARHQRPHRGNGSRPAHRHRGPRRDEERPGGLVDRRVPRHEPVRHLHHHLQGG